MRLQQKNKECILKAMEWLIILAAIILLYPLAALVVRSLKSLGVVPASYYDFNPIFSDTKPWSVALYIIIIAVFSFVILIVAGIPLIRVTA